MGSLSGLNWQHRFRHIVAVQQISDGNLQFLDPIWQGCYMAILSIQSHVSFGYVGNSAAGIALHCLGHEIWPVHTVLFSNHPGYGTFQGDVQKPESVGRILSGLLDRGIGQNCDAVLSGYLGHGETGEAVAGTVAAIRAINAKTIYVCDPVMGDLEEGVYVAPEVVNVIADKLVPTADIITPNAFELSVLSGAAVGSIDDALLASQGLIGAGPLMVIVTSVTDPNQPDRLNTLMVTNNQAWSVSCPKRVNPPKGAGDLLSALWLGRYLKGLSGEQALAVAVSSCYALIQRAEREGIPELPLVSAQHLIKTPDSNFEAELLPFGGV
jgi:pyridoxine kinase